MQIALITSIDNIKSMYLWDETMMKNYNFVFFEVHSFNEYDIEKEYSTPMFSNKNDMAEVGISFIFKSITQNQK
jgi:hypothetical protein